jgi:hypothetical protein
MKSCLTPSQPTYLSKHIVAHDPFKTLDLHAVAPMIHLGIKRARERNSNVKVRLSLTLRLNMLISYQLVASSF